MGKTKHMSEKFSLIVFLSVGLLFSPITPGIYGQQRPLAQADATTPHRTRLILKDGSYQIVMSYRVVGNRVRYVSAERGGAEEEIPAELVDFDATQKWERQHSQPSEGDMQSGASSTIDPELLKEEADRAAMIPEVATDLRLPDLDNVLALDTYRGQAQLVPLPQSDGELNHNTAHNILKAVVNPLSSSHQLIQLKGEKSMVQLHIDQPAIYIRIGEPIAVQNGSTPITVDTHGASTAINDKHPLDPTASRYVIVRADVRTGSRVVASFKISALGTVKRDEDVIETTMETLPGGHWMKLTPKQSLLFGEYALMEVLSDREVNLGVWDFGVHPTAPANRDAILPQPKRPFALAPRRNDQ
jgi:hypothetical protein